MIADPLTTYRFMVTLDPGDAYLPPAQAALVALSATAGFQEVGGLGADLEVTPYPEGGRNDYVHQLPVRHTWTRISLKRGMLADPGLWFWYQAGLTQSLGARRDGAILLLDASGIPTATWAFRAGIAVKWSGPTLNSMQNAVAIEGVEIAHHGITQVVFPPVGALL